MSIESILIVLFYSVKPYLWLMSFLLLFLITCYFIKLSLPLFNQFQTVLISVSMGLLVALSAPYITLSKLQYVSTFADWGALFGILVVATFYCWLSLILLFKGQHR